MRRDWQEKGVGNDGPYSASLEAEATEVETAPAVDRDIRTANMRSSFYAVRLRFHAHPANPRAPVKKRTTVEGSGTIRLYSMTYDETGQ